MAYEKHTWECGEEITAEKLNNIENGIENAGSGGALIVTITDDDQTGDSTMNKTFGEIMDALSAGNNVVVVWGEAGVFSYGANVIIAAECHESSGTYDGYVVLRSNGTDIVYECEASSASALNDEYPVFSNGQNQ